MLILFPAVESGQGNHSTANTTKGPIIGGPFTLIDTENRTITERNLRGNWVLLYFGYTSSPDVGPEQVRIMAKTIDKLGLPLISTIISCNFTMVSLLTLFCFTWCKSQDTMSRFSRCLLLLTRSVIHHYNSVLTFKVRPSQQMNIFGLYVFCIS